MSQLSPEQMASLHCAELAVNLVEISAGLRTEEKIDQAILWANIARFYSDLALAIFQKRHVTMPADLIGP